jgi:hypothetical protein
MNFVGGVIYLGGQLLEFVTRPDAPARFLGNYHYYDSGDHSSSGEKAELANNRHNLAEARRRRQLEKFRDKP